MLAWMAWVFVHLLFLMDFRTMLFHDLMWSFYPHQEPLIREHDANQ